MPPPAAEKRHLASGTQDIRQALDRCEPLASLAQRLRDSQSRLVAVQALLAPALRAQVRAGPIDAEAWTLLAGNQAVAAKLRQLLPALQARLVQQSFASLPIRVRLLPPG